MGFDFASNTNTVTTPIRPYIPMVAFAPMNASSDIQRTWCDQMGAVRPDVPIVRATPGVARHFAIGGRYPGALARRSAGVVALPMAMAAIRRYRRTLTWSPRQGRSGFPGGRRLPGHGALAS